MKRFLGALALLLILSGIAYADEECYKLNGTTFCNSKEETGKPLVV